MQIEQKQNRIYKPQSNTTLSAEETNQVTTELENVIASGGLTPNAGTLTQVRDAIQNIVDDAANDLQTQIDAITSASDVFDVVGTYAQLQAYDTSTVPVNDIIKVLQDETRNNAMTYYRWSGSAWVFIGSEGPYYTVAETDSTFATKAELPGIATASQVGLVKPDGVTLQVDANGALSSALPTVVADGTTIQNNSGQLSAIAVKDQRTANAIKTWTGTKAQYDAIASKDANTLYNVTDENMGVAGALSDLSNLTDAGNIVAAKASMPSDTYIDLTLGASGSRYTAPADGYFYLSKRAASNNQYTHIDNKTNSILLEAPVPYSNANSTVLMPVIKGDIIQVNYNTTGNTEAFRFYYAEGSKSE